MLTKWTLGLATAAFIGALAMVPAARAQMGPPPVRIDLYSDMPQAEPGDDPANWSARQNVAESQRYEQLLHTNVHPALRYGASRRRSRRLAARFSRHDLCRR